VRTTIVIGSAALISIAAINAVSAASNHYVRGYTTRNGIHVIPHHQTNTNSTNFDNWSTRGNINPYTGKAGTTESVLN
jgi:hypothetical protein